MTLAESQDTYADIAMQIWDHAELGYQEHKSSQLLQDTLANAGFKVEAGVANIPTAFVASYGEGQPVIGILAEFDALPGISQAAVPIRQGLPGKAAGHACGHHLFGAGSTAAAIAVKDWLADTPRQGTIRLYGTPAEEGGSGKVYMVRAGLFDDVDTVLHWHAENETVESEFLALGAAHCHQSSQQSLPQIVALTDSWYIHPPVTNCRTWFWPTRHWAIPRDCHAWFRY